MQLQWSRRDAFRRAASGEISVAELAVRVFKRAPAVIPEAPEP